MSSVDQANNDAIEEDAIEEAIEEHQGAESRQSRKGALCKSLLDRVDVEEAIEVAIEERGGSCKETCRAHT